MRLRLDPSAAVGVMGVSPALFYMVLLLNKSLANIPIISSLSRNLGEPPHTSKAITIAIIPHSEFIIPNLLYIIHFSERVQL